MKKYLMLAALMCLGAAVAKAETLDVPKGIPGALATADYGGVSVATITFSSASALIFSGPVSISYIHVTSANAGAFLTDFIVVRETHSLTAGATSAGNQGNSDFATTDERYRVYVGTAIGTGQGYTNQWVSNGLTGFDYAFPQPIRLLRGAVVKASGLVFGPIVVGYTKLGGKQ